jgi:hypothetical protein
MPRPGRFNPGNEAGTRCIGGGRASERCVENLARTGIRFPDRSASSGSLHRLGYPDPWHDHSFVELEACVLPYQQDSVCYLQAVTLTEHSISITCLCMKHCR